MGLVDELAAELGTDSDSLRSALLAGGQDSETLSPIDFTIDPSGNVGIQALRLKAPTTRVPPAGDGVATISWTRDDTGALVADIRSYVDKGALLRDRINLILETLGQGAAVKLVDIPQSNAAEIDITAGAITKKLLAQDGSSDFGLNSNPTVNNVTATRALNGVYQPSTTRFVEVTARLLEVFNISAASASLFIGPTNVPATLVDDYAMNNATGTFQDQNDCRLRTVVPPGWFYKITAASLTLQRVTERDFT